MFFISIKYLEKLLKASSSVKQSIPLSCEAFLFFNISSKTLQVTLTILFISELSNYA